MKRLARAGSFARSAHPAVAAAVLAVLATGCGAVPESDVAAPVGDVTTSVDDLEAVLDAVVEEQDSAVTPDTATGTVEAQTARSVLSAFIGRDANDAFLAANGEAITEEDRQAWLATVPEGTPALEYPPEVLALLVDLNAGATARARVVAADDELQAGYEASPGDLGVICVRHILVATEPEAQEILVQLDAGTPFAELVARSTDQASAINGGAITGQQGQPCLTAGAARQQLVPPFVEGALAAVPGQPVGPVQSDFGWHVIDARPYEDIAEGLPVAVGDARYEAYVADLDVEVDPRYGRWEPAAGAVVALEEPAPDETG